MIDVIMLRVNLRTIPTVQLYRMSPFPTIYNLLLKPNQRRTNDNLSQIETAETVWQKIRCVLHGDNGRPITWVNLSTCQHSSPSNT